MWGINCYLPPAAQSMYRPIIKFNFFTGKGFST